jgi:hypothetical protein
MKFATVKESALKSSELDFGQLIAQEDVHTCVCCESFRTYVMECAQKIYQKPS